MSLWFFQVPWLSHQYPVLPGYHLKLTEYLESHNSTYLNIQQCKSSSIDSLFTISFQVVWKLRPNNEQLSKITLIKIDGGNFFLILGLLSFHECKTCALRNLRLVIFLNHEKCWKNKEIHLETTSILHNVYWYIINVTAFVCIGVQRKWVLQLPFQASCSLACTSLGVILTSWKTFWRAGLVILLIKIY